MTHRHYSVSIDPILTSFRTHYEGYKYNGKGNSTHGGPPRFMGYEKMRTRWEWTWWAMKIEYSPTKNHFDDPSSIFLVMPQIRMYTFPPKLRQLHCRKLGKLGKRGKLTRTLEYRNWENSGFGQKRFYSLNTTFGSFVSLFYVQQELCSRKFRRSWYQNKNRWTKCSESEHIKLYSNILNLIKRIIRSKQFACRFLIRETLGKPNGLFEIRNQRTKIFDSPPVVDRAVGRLLFECII